MVITSAKHLRIAEETKEHGMALHHAIQAQTTLESAQSLVGSASLSKYTGMNIEELEKSIEDVMKTLSSASKRENNGFRKFVKTS
jgi:hypothetical protein